MLWVRHLHPKLRSSCRRGPPLQPFPRHVVVLPDQGVASDRKKPPRRRDGLRPRRAFTAPGVHRPHPTIRRDSCPPPPRRRVFDDGRRKVAPDTSLRPDRLWPLRPVAPRPGIRAVLRVPPCGYQPMDAEPRLRQPLRRAPQATRGWLPPDRRPGRHWDSPTPSSAERHSGQALLSVSGHRGPARTAPGPT